MGEGQATSTYTSNFQARHTESARAFPKIRVFDAEGPGEGLELGS